VPPTVKSVAVATEADVRRIALSLPDTTEKTDDFAFSVANAGKPRAILWVWKERVSPKQPRIPHPGVIAVRVASNEVKRALLSSDEEKFFTEPHYQGFPAILVRLAAIGNAELRELIVDAWRCQAPRALVKRYDARKKTSRVR
jgi:hypothetical protein